MVRIEIDSELEKELDKIKSEHYWRIRGKGHSDTVRFLLEQYQTHGNINKILHERLNEIPGILRAQFKEAFRDFIRNLVKG